MPDTAFDATSDAAGDPCGVCPQPANGVSICVQGQCELACRAGYANCDGVDHNGCETELTTLSACGACGVVCSRANASASCLHGSCVVSQCSPGFGNCDGLDANGCETSLTTLDDCGACGMACSRAQATATCAAGQCQIGACHSHWGDRDGVPHNGCEHDQRNWTPPLRLAVTNGSDEESQAQIAVGPAGHAHAVWREVDSSIHRVAHSRYTPGSGWSNPSFVDGSQHRTSIEDPDVAIDASGTAMVLWRRRTSQVYHVYERRYANAWNAEVQIDDSGLGHGRHPSVAASDHRDFVAAWEQEVSGTVRILTNHSTFGSGWGQATIRDDGGPSAGQSPARIAWTPSGDCALAWYQRDGAAMLAKRFSPASGWGSTQVLNSVSPVAAPELTIDELGRAVVLWKQQPDLAIWATVDAGLGFGPATQLSSVASATLPRMALAPTAGHGIAVWQEQVGGQWRIAAGQHENGTGWQSSTYIDAGGSDARRPYVAVANNEALAVWFEWNPSAGHNDVYSRIYVFGHGWKPIRYLGAAGLVDPATGHFRPRIKVLYHDDGTAVVIWKEMLQNGARVWVSHYR